jgi:hypothetical protein
MKKTLLTLIFVLSTVILFAQKEEYKREINKEFSVKENSKLSISNTFGNVNIIESNEGKIVFKIEITTKHKNAETAREYAERINVDFTSKDNRVSAKTVFSEKKYTNASITVNYVVMVPSSTTMDFNIEFGDLVLHDTPKPLNVDIQHGDIKAHNIADANINTQYGNVKFEKCKKLNLTAAYSDLEATTMEEANIDTQYGEVIFGKCGDAKIVSRYSDIKADVTANTIIDINYADVSIDKCNNLIFKSRYADLKSIEVLNAIIDIQYADVEIGKCKDLDLVSRYADFQIGESNSVKADSQYGDFKIKSVNDFAIASFYTDIIIDVLNNSFAASKVGYGDLKITNISKNFSKIAIDKGLYSDIKLGLTEQHSFKANISVGEDGSFRPGKITFNNVVWPNKNNVIVGTAGKSDNPKAEVIISATYGDVVFK